MKGIGKIIDFPRIGQRILRSVTAVALCFVVYLLRGKRGIPFYSALAVLQCIQPYTANTYKVARKRVLGTFIGAIWGFLVILLQVYALQGRFNGTFIWYMLIALLTGAVLYSTVVLNLKETSYFSCVVFLSIVVNHITDESPVGFAINRVLDTLIGVGLALVVNAWHLPRKKHKDTLYVSGIDDTIFDQTSTLSDYSKIELNRMIDEGAKFTVSTIRTPASVREALPGIRFHYPIIAMDGAVLYDMEENAYLLKYQMTEKQAELLHAFLKKEHLQAFVNTVTDDLLVIYYQTLSNEAEQGIYETRRHSPYRNYVHTQEDIVKNVVYLLVIDRRERIEAAYSHMKEEAWAREMRITKADSLYYPSYSYLKIYTKHATRENMLNNLMALYDIRHVVTFGSIPDTYDVLITDAGKDSMVKNLRKLYEPVCLFGKEVSHTPNQHKTQ